MAEWKLASAEQTKGLLDKSNKFLGNSNLRACIVLIPLALDPKKAILTLGGIVSAAVRSFEIWWDSTKQELNIMIISSEPDLDKFKQSLINAYPNIDFEDSDELVPDWFEKENKNDYQIFDIGYEHGHFFTIFDQARAHQLITQIANTIQLSKNAWVQFVFTQNSLVPHLQKHYSKISKHYKTVTKTDYTGQWDGLVSEGEGPRDHPEKFGEFARNFKILDNFSRGKLQASQTVMSIRGVIDSNEELSLDFSEIESLPVENIRSNIEHLTKNTYYYNDFFSEKKPDYIKINSKKQNIKKLTCLG